MNGFIYGMKANGTNFHEKDYFFGEIYFTPWIQNGYWKLKRERAKTILKGTGRENKTNEGEKESKKKDKKKQVKEQKK